MASYALTDKAILIKPEDDVAVAKAELKMGPVLEDGGWTFERPADLAGILTLGTQGERAG